MHSQQNIKFCRCACSSTLDKLKKNPLKSLAHYFSGTAKNVIHRSMLKFHVTTASVHSCAVKW